MGKVISFLNQKGGSGKTTLATNVAAQLHKDGHRVALVDIDPQGSASIWGEARTDEDAFLITKMGKEISRTLRGFAKDYGYIIVDGAPQVADLMAASIIASDMVIIPVMPSPYDAWAAKELVELVKTRQVVTMGTPLAAFVISRVIKRTRLVGEVKEVLQEYDLPTLKSTTTQLQAYPDTAKVGQSVSDLDKDHKANIEIRKLTREIIEALERGSI